MLQINLPYLLKTFKQTIHVHRKTSSTSSNAEDTKALQILQQNLSDRQKARYVTDLESTLEPYKTTPPMQYCSTLIRRDKLKDIEFTPLELINSKRESIRTARESFYIHVDKAKTMQPCGINSYPIL